MISPNDSGVVLYMPFNEGSGTTAYDYSTGSTNGTITGATYEKIKDGSYALDFNGTTDYVSTTLSTIEEQFSICLWVYINTYTDNVHILDTGYYNSSVGSKGILIELNTSGTNGLLTAIRESTTENQVQSTTVISTGNWYHIVMTFDGTTHKQYINGILEGTTDIVITPTSLTNDLTLGRRAYTSSDYLNGKIRFPIILDRVLSESEIKKTYQDTYIE